MSEPNKDSVTVDVTYTNAEAFVVERVLDAFMGGGAKEIKSVKGPYRLANNLKIISEALSTYKTKIQETGEKHIATEEYTDESGETKTRKVVATHEVKQEDGSWKEQPVVDPKTGAPSYKIADPDAYTREMNDLGEEKLELKLSRIPLSLLDGATGTGQLFYHCSDFIHED